MSIRLRDSLFGTVAHITRDTSPVIGTATDILVIAGCIDLRGSTGSFGEIFQLGNDEQRPQLRRSSNPGELAFKWTCSAGDGEGHWFVGQLIEASSQAWGSFCIKFDPTDIGATPVVRLNMQARTPDLILTAGGTFDTPGAGYRIGGGNPWDPDEPQLEHIQVIIGQDLTDDEMDGIIEVPGSYKPGLALWLPLLASGDLNDYSGNNYHPTSDAKIQTASVAPPEWRLRTVFPVAATIRAHEAAANLIISPSFPGRLSARLGELYYQEPDPPIKIHDLGGVTTATLDDLTCAAAGTVTAGAGEVLGTATITLAALTVDADGTVLVAGVATITLAALTVDADGTVEVRGVLTVTLDALTVDADGTVALAGILAQTLDALTLDADGIVSTNEIFGLLAQTLDALTLDADGTVAGTEITGTLTRTLDDLTAVGAGTAFFPNFPNRRRSFYQIPIGPTHVRVF